MFAVTPRATASPSAKLVFARGPDTEICPDEEGFRAAVAARIGYDPFFPYAKRTVVTRIDAIAGGRFRARMEVLDDKGTLLGEKSFVSAKKECTELVRTLALAVSLAIDVADPPPPPAEPEPPKPEPPKPEPAASAPSVFEERETPKASVEPAPTRIELSATMRGFVGLAPSANLGVALGAAVRRGPWSIGLEGSWNPAVESAVGTSARISQELVAGSLLPCANWRFLFGCAVGTGGRVQVASSGVRQPGADDALFVAIGGRVGAELEASPLLVFRASGDIAGIIVNHDIRIGSNEVERIGGFFVAAGLSAVVRF